MGRSGPTKGKPYHKEQKKILLVYYIDGKEKTRKRGEAVGKGSIVQIKGIRYVVDSVQVFTTRDAHGLKVHLNKTPVA